MKPVARPLVSALAALALLTGGAALAQEDHLVDAHTLIEAGELEHARQALLEAVDLDPNRVDLHFQLGLLELRLDNPEAAAFNFSVAAAAFGKRFDLVYNQAISLAEAGDFARASQLLQEAIDAGQIPGELRAQVLEALGDAQYEAGAFDLAARTYAQLFDLTGDTTAEYKTLLARFELGEREQLVVPLKRLRVPVGHRTSKLLADIYYDTGLAEYGERELKDARKRAVEEVNFEALTDVSVALASHYYLSERYAEAIELLVDLPTIEHDQLARYLLGIAYLATGEADAALRVFEAPLQNPSDAFLLLSMVAAGAGDDAQKANDLARHLVSKFAGELPRLARTELGIAALVAAAQAYEQTGRLDEAAGLASQIPRANLSPSQRVQLGDLHYRAGEYQAAATHYEEVLAQAAVDADIYLAAARNYADALLAQRRWGDAKRAYERVIALTPFDTVAYYHYGWALIGLNERPAAQEAFQTAAERGYEPARDVLAKHF